MAILKLEGLVHGHYECRSLDETLRVFTDLLAAEVVDRRDGTAIVKHPNTDWLLVVHEGGPDAPTKPHGNHYGFRVADHTEIEAAWSYIHERQDDYGITGLREPGASHFAYSIYMDEPGGNTLELEYYNPKAAGHGRRVAAGHWRTPLPAERFPGRGYVPQALAHGTMETSDKEASNRFYTEVLGLEIVGGGSRATYIAHSETPWYIVVLPAEPRNYLAPVNRYTLKVASSEEVQEAHRTFRASGKDIGVTDVWDLEAKGKDDTSFIFADLDRNWWEVTSAAWPLP